MNTLTNYAEKKAKQFLNLLQGYTKGIRITAILILLLMGIGNAWADSGDFYNTYLTYTFGTTNGSAEDKDNGTGLSKDLGTLKSGSFKVTAVYLKCWDDWGTNYKSEGGQMCYNINGGSTQYLQGFSRSNKSGNNYEWKNTNANLTIANSTDKSGSYTLTCWFQTWGNNWGDRFFPKSSGNYTFTYKIAPPSVKDFTVTPSGNKLSGSGTQNDPYIIKYNGSLTLTLSGSQNHTDANSTIQYNTSGTWDTTPSRTISNITSTDVKNVTVKARYKNKTEALYGTETSQTIYYRSEQVYTVTFNANGHGTAPAAQTISKGSKATKPADLTATGYTFGGWYKEAGCTNAFDFNTAINANITLYAKWTANKYTVTLDNQSATTAGTASVQATYGSAMPSATMPQKTGYTFGGYYTAINGGGTKYYNANGSSAKNWDKTAATTLYAKWTANTYTITYKDQGDVTFSGTHESGYPTIHTYGTETTLKTASKTGYTFEGWYKEPACTNKVTTLGATAYTANITLYAKWTANKYTVTLDNQSATTAGTASVQATYGSAMPSATMPQKTGYTFGGYYTAINGGGTKYYNANGSSAKNWDKTAATTLYAKWTETVHTVTVVANDNTYGTVSPTSVSVGMHTASVKITATPKFGHVFKYWSATDGVTISDEYSTSTTIKATQAGTLTAVFAKGEPVSIYMRANHIWKRADARYAVYYWHGSDNGWADMEEVGSCDETYYKAQIPFGYTDYLIARLSPYNKENSFTPDNPTEKGPFWNKTADIVMPQDGKTFYNMRKIYFRPNNLWITNHNARFAAYFLVKGDQTQTQNKWMSLLPTETDGLYWCDFPTEHNFDQVIFCSMEPANQTNDWGNRWNETAPQELINVNCFTMTEGEWGKGTGNDANKPGATGSWSMIGEKPGYDLTLYASSFGEYGYIHNNTRYYSPKSGSEIHKIPFENPTIKIFSNPYSDQYRGDVMYNVIGANDRSELQPGETLTFHCNTVLDDNYKTKGTHVVYLAIPYDNGNVDYTWWYQMASHTNYLYAFHSRTEEGKGHSVQMTEVGTATVNNQKHTYYRCVIPAGVNTIRFEKHHTANKTNVLQTIDLPYDIPLNSINCYRLDRSEDNKKAGIWEEAPGFNGDYRVICQRKEGNNVVEYASDVIRKGTTSQTISLHIYTVGADENYPKLILQKHDGTEWKAVSGQDKLVTDISKIMSDTKENGCGVWNFIVTQNADGSNPQVNFTSPERYTGNYYIRTNNAEGQWRNYTLSTNQMTFSSYAKHNSGYSHYFCKWVDINMINEKESSKLPGHNNNVKFIIANDHGAAISAEMAEDAHTASGGILPQDANVRWTWNEKDNSVSRAYILGAYDPDKGGARNENIVVNYTTGAQKDTLEDKENWIYEIDLKDVQVNSQLKELQATYPSENKTVYIDETTTKTVTPSTQIFASNLNMLDAEAGNNNTYTVRIIYDFKIDKTLVMLLPDKNYESHIGIDVFIDRTDQGEATQVKATITRDTPAEDPGYTVYGTMTFTQEHIMSLVKTEWERLYYWVSFPFDVRISDVFGFGEYGKHWIMEYYDGAERAKEGCWIDSPTYWRYITDTTYVAGKALEDTNGNPQNGVLVANRGYVLALARNIANMGLFKNNNEYVRLYFPSMNKITSIDQNMQDVPVTLPAHPCDIQRDNRYIYDSHWNIIGVPSYANKNQTIAQDGFFYYYTYNTKDNTYTATSIGDIEFKSMHAYMVQHAGAIDWKTWHSASSTPELLAQRRTSQTPDHYSLRLELQRDGQYADQTFVQLHADDATTEFDINKDLTKILNAGANIYTLTGEQQIQVAGNVLPITKTTIPVGVQVAQSGTYTFALPDGTDGISVTLVDNLTGAHTNMLLDKYTVTLDAGTIENRFYLVVDPERAATSVDNIGDEATGDKANTIEKFLIDGKLFIRTADGIFDAKGQRL